jgi:hypothetical protein
MIDRLRELAAHASRPDRLYPVRTNEDYGFYCGQLADGRQALATIDVRLLLVVALFDVAGNLVGEEERDLAGRWPIPAHGYPEVDHAELQEYLRAEFGVEPAVIRVRQFVTDRVVIFPLPGHYQEFLDDPQSPSFERGQRERFPAYIKEWIEGEHFVLLWGNDYWLDKNGEVTSS